MIMATRGKITDPCLPPLLAAYLAGLFDGEGHFSLVISRKSQTAKGVIPFYMRSGMSMASTSLDLCELMANWFGGHVSAFKPVGGKKPAWSWKVFDVGSANGALALLPYLRLKQEQAQIILDFHGEKTNVLGKVILSEDEILRRVGLLRRLRADVGSGKPIDEQRIEEYLDCYRLQRLSERAPGNG